jgi:cation diffusion facilitator CzcD-associated flavoprotein CzcO
VSTSEGEPLAAQVLVIGAGPGGLAVAGCLAQQGVRAEMIEAADAVGASWRNHYRRLHLHTVKQHSALPHRPFPDAYPRYVPRAKVVDYLADYAQAFALQPRLGEEAVAITRQDGHWLTRCRSGLSFLTPSVVLATGANGRPNVPSYPGQEAYRGELLHSHAYRDGQPFAGRRVLVVGMGNTGAEIALDVAQAGGKATLAVRSPVNIVLRDVLGRPTQVTSIMLSRLPDRIADAIARFFRDWTVGDLSRYGLATSATSPLRQLREEGRTPVIDVGALPLIRRGEIAVRPGIAAFTPSGVRFTDGREEDFDAVILATGYHAEVAGLFPQEQVPVDGKGLPTNVVGTGALAGLYFVGYDIRQAGGLLRSIGQQALRVAEDIASGSIPGSTQPAP